MTRRIALAILISACTMLIVGGVGAYVAMRQTLLAELDDAIIERATAVLRTTGAVGQALQHPPVPPGDRYMIRSDQGQTIGRPPPERSEPQRPTVLSATFASAGDGLRVRSMTMRFETPSRQNPITIVYSTSAARFDRTMKRLAITMALVMGIGAALTAAVAARVSEIATRPLHATARTIGSIDERHLDRRIDVAALPSELAPMATRLNEMIERLERAFAQRRQFMIDAAHELRTPVAALRTTLEVALQRPGTRDNPAILQILNRCLTSTRMLDRLADVLTEQVRGETPAMAQDVELVNVGRLLADCADICEPLSHAKNIRLVRSFPSQLALATQPDRLKSIVMNLLSNAIEYTQAGGDVEIGCECDGQTLSIRIRDNGPGIDPKQLPHVFEPFYRADGARRRQGEHLGLGLYLVRTHTEALGGTCKAHSALGAGTTVIITLPVMRDTTRSFPAAEAGVEQPQRDEMFQRVP